MNDEYIEPFKRIELEKKDNERALALIREKGLNIQHFLYMTTYYEYNISLGRFSDYKRFTAEEYNFLRKIFGLYR